MRHALALWVALSNSFPNPLWERACSRKQSTIEPRRLSCRLREQARSHRWGEVCQLPLVYVSAGGCFTRRKGFVTKRRRRLLQLA
ncbi:hypothetical protein EIY72_23985 [Pseudomonas vancouverensis]|uniref:Uncharacterized protein n=1 Tax=Pseudomonas vancouverensis TaxID=95300 RepID=A0A4R4JVF5_PSEVA|nr:hypothetical protein F7R09_22550 [Pseudomonas vancouverensis]TDB58036.1 hypothetical protein EIY72_23985 [Pseudomonas vancouverensis]